MRTLTAARCVGSRRTGRSMIALASGLRVYLACGITDMRKGMTGLAMLVHLTHLTCVVV
jgi:hypothetical protein